MFVVDTNVLIYGVNRADRRHKSASGWLDRTLGSGTTVGFAWTVLTGFIRIATHPRIMKHPIASTAAVDVVRSWLARPNAVALQPTVRHLDLLEGLLGETDSVGNLVNDAHLAALALEHGGTIVTYDTDFALFGVPWQRPA